MKVLLPDAILFESNILSKPSDRQISQWIGYPPYVLSCDQLVMALCFECPAPVPGLYSISVNVWGQSPPTSTNSSVLSGISSMKLHQSIPNIRIDFHLPPTKSLPCCPYPITKLFEILNPRLVIDVLCCALSESRILFHTADLSKLPIVCECIVTLLYPLKWSHVYLPVVPSPLLDLIEAPVPFILGTHSSWLQQLPCDCLADLVTVDCDLGSIDIHNGSPMSFPEDIDRWLMLSFKLLTMDTLSEDPLCTGKLSCQQASLYIQIVIFDVMLALLKDVPICLFYLDRNTPIFNRPLFLSEFTSTANQKFIKILSDTNAFHRFTDALHTLRLEFFMECSESFPSVDWMDDVEINPLAVNTDINSPSDTVSAVSSSVFEASSSINSTSPSHGEQNYSETMNPPIPPTSVKNRGHIPFLSSIKQFMSSKAKSNSNSTSAENISVHETPTRQGHVPFPTPMHKLFHSSFRAEDVEELIASTEAASDSNISSEIAPPLPRAISRRLSFSKQKSANSSSFRSILAEETSSCAANPDGDLAASDITTDPNGSRKSDQVGSPESSGINPDGTLPEWLYFGKNFTPDIKSHTPDIPDILKHRLDLYLSYIHLLHKHQNLDPVLFIDIYDPSFIDEGLSSIASRTRKRSSTFFPDSSVGDGITPASTGSRESGRISVRFPKKFFNDDDLPSSALDFKATDQPADDSPHSSRLRSATNAFGSSVDVVKKRLVLQRSSSVVGVGVNIAHAESSTKDERRRSVSTLLTGVKIDRETGRTFTSDSIEQMNTSTDATATGISHTPTAPSEGSIEYPTHSNHSIESTIFTADDITASLDKGSDSSHTLDLHSHLDKIRNAIDNLPFAPVVFEHNRLTEAMNMINVWTLSDLAAATGESINELAAKYADTVEKDLCVSDFSIMYKHASRPSSGKRDNSTKRRRNMISNRFVGSKQSSTQFSHWLDKSPAYQSCSPSILDYIKIVFSGLNVPPHELNIIRQTCYDELKISANRGSLLEILKQSHSNEKESSKSKQSSFTNSFDGESTFFPLHSESFAAMVELFHEILSICSHQRDYLHAYDLLIAGGLYFDIGDEAMLQSYESRDVKFLSSTIKSHHIYQKPELWLAILRIRLDSSFSPPSSPLNTSTIEVYDEEKNYPEHLNPKRVHSIILETHAMLYMMHSLGVKPERAMMFIKNVVDMYDLDWKLMELQLFLDRLWPSHGRRSSVTIGQMTSDGDFEEDESYGEDGINLDDRSHSYYEYHRSQSDRTMPNQKSAREESIPDKVPRKRKSWFRWSSSSKT